MQTNFFLYLKYLTLADCNFDNGTSDKTILIGSDFLLNIIGKEIIRENLG